MEAERFWPHVLQRSACGCYQISESVLTGNLQCFFEKDVPLKATPFKVMDVAPCRVGQQER